ncbi:DinB family protein [Nocardioides sambongensis]|uniref:DinB family protein n=1 Tax=Nocardioides sambongensis TaxID=2589074 RepID=UPI00112B639C|nr:DinB family protein [Nocardioides sambongensis]
MSVPRTEPPRAADETTMLRAFLDYHRATLLRQAEGLDAEQLGRSLPPSTMTLGGMLKHLAFVEDWWFNVTLLGDEPAPPWDTVDWEADGDWDWHSAAHDTPDGLRTLLAGAIARSEEILGDRPDLERVAVRHRPGRSPVTLRWILVHMIEEYARHCGHADLIRESVDGATDL